jgi:hypothetical protein
MRDPSEETGTASVCRDQKAKRTEPDNQRVEEVEALDGFFRNVIQVLPQFLGIIFCEYQRSIVRGSGEIDLERHLILPNLCFAVAHTIEV